MEFWSACSIKLDTNKNKKSRTVCKSCYNEENQRKNNSTSLIQIQQSKIDNFNDNKNNRTLLVGPSFPVETYLILKFLPRIPNRDFYKNTKSPPGQYYNTEIKIGEKGEEIKLLNEYENAIIVFDNFPGSSNVRYFHKFFIRGRHNNFTK